MNKRIIKLLLHVYTSAILVLLDRNRHMYIIILTEVYSSCMTSLHASAAYIHTYIHVSKVSLLQVISNDANIYM